MTQESVKKHYLLASDFDQTLSFNDSGIELCRLLGIDSFEDKVTGLARLNLVQEGAELSYLLRHDPQFRCIRKEHLYEAGKRIRLKQNVDKLEELINSASEDYVFSFYVVSAAPEEVVQSALEGIVSPDRIIGTRFVYDETGEIQSIIHCPAGYGKVSSVQELQKQLGIGQNRIIYMGDGSSDIHVMLHVNHLGGMTIAVSENKYIKHVAKRVVLSDDVLGVTIPILEKTLGFDESQIQQLFESKGFFIQKWDKLQSDSLTILKDGDGKKAEEAAA